MAYSRDYKERAVAYKEERHTFKQLKEAFGIWSETYYERKEKLENGYCDIQFKRERNRKIDKAALKQAVVRKPDAFLAEQFNCTATAVFYALEKMGITRKKDFYLQRKAGKAAGGVSGADKTRGAGEAGVR